METRPRRSQFVLLGLGLVLYLWGFVGQTSLARLPLDFDDQVGPYPLIFAGVEAATRDEARFLAEGQLPGSRIEVRSADGATREITLLPAFGRLYLLVTLVSGGLFLWISLFLFGPRADNAALRDLMLGTWAYGLSILIGGVYFPKEPWGPDLVRGILQLALLAVLPVLLLHLACVFPRPVRGFSRVAWVFPVLLVVAGVLVVWQERAFLAYFLEPSPDTFRGLALPQKVADAALVAQVLGGLAVLGVRGLTETDPRERSLLRGLLAGFAVGVTPYVFLRTAPGVLDLDLAIPPAFDRVFELAIPLAVVFVVVRNRFLDIDVVVRRPLLYSGAAGAIVGLGILAVVALGLALDPTLRSWHWLPVLGLGLAAGVLFAPARERIGRALDRRLFHLPADPAAALARFGRRLDDAGDQDDLARATRRFLEEQVGLERAGVALWIGEEMLVEGIESHAVAARALALMAGRSRAPLAAAGATDSPHLETPRYPHELLEAGFPAAVPLESAPDGSGAILLGAKRTGRRLAAPDLHLATRVADAARLGLARMRLVQEAERAQLKDRFFSRVAHDLRTPLTSIGWSMRNLLDGVAGELGDSQRDYLEGVRTSTRYLERLVENLLEMGRLDRGQVRLSLATFDLAVPLGDAVSTVRPLAEARGIRITTDPGPVSVRADADRVTEVAVNLLENAVRYSPDGAGVHVRLHRDPPGFSVEDEGPGLGDADPERLFARFEQGTPSPFAGQHGFGLGLHIVASYVRLLEGSVTAADRPGGGASFTVHLPGPGSAEEP